MWAPHACQSSHFTVRYLPTFLFQVVCLDFEKSALHKELAAQKRVATSNEKSLRTLQASLADLEKTAKEVAHDKARIEKLYEENKAKSEEATEALLRLEVAKLQLEARIEKQTDASKRLEDARVKELQVVSRFVRLPYSCPIVWFCF